MALGMNILFASLSWLLMLIKFSIFYGLVPLIRILLFGTYEDDGFFSVKSVIKTE